ncbi:hypothetical protein [Nonomuraea sp. NPDC050643]|uniref:hypothetical protein n=1 Tax=Nonomuraea sp. NPDC050643 TaxID=3155660 RepID=UPI0033EFE0FF
MRLLRKLATVVVAGAAVVATLATPAQAAGGTKYCPVTGTLEPWCDLQLYPTRFPGGTISIDVDVTGPNPVVGHWTLYIDGGSVCGADFAYSDPPRSWVCRNVRAGYPTLSVPRGYEAARIGLRW